MYACHRGLAPLGHPILLTPRGPYEKIIVHGHSWRGDTAEVLGHRVGLDTGAYATGVLSAVRLDGPEVAILTARDPQASPWNPWAIPLNDQST